MPQPFNPTHSVRFELARGQVTLDGAGHRLLIPSDALQQLCESAGPEGVKDFGRRMGTEIGRRVASRVDVSASVAALVEHLGGDLALSGLGSFGVEVWGQALVLTISDSPFAGAGGEALLSAVLEGALQRAFARDTAVVPLGHEGGKSRLLAVSPKTAESVRGWLASGTSWGDALSRLGAGGSGRA
jgi:hypothetical protein